MSKTTNERKDLQSALLIIKETSKSNVKINKLLKISIRTEDGEFALHLNRLIKLYKAYIPPGHTIPEKINLKTFPSNHPEWVSAAKPIKEAAIKFITDRLAADKPHWQVIAEHHGWVKMH